MSERKPERRSRSRLAASLPVDVRVPQRNIELSAETRDISSGGVFLYTRSAIDVGSELELVLTLPAELTGGAKQWVCCQASVVRVENPTESGKFGVAAAVRNLRALPEIIG